MSDRQQDNTGAAMFLRWPTGKLIIAVCAALIIAIYVVIGFNVIHDHDKSIQRAHNSAQNIVGVVAEYIGQIVSSADSVLRDVAGDYDMNDITSDRNLLDLRQDLKHSMVLVSSVASFFVLDADGKLLASTSDTEHSGANFAYREYFQALRDNPQEGLFVGPPVRGIVGLVSGQHVIHIARSLLSPEGKFKGIVAAAIRLEPLARVFDLLHLDVDDAVALFREDGRLLLRKPFVEEYIGQNFGSLALFRELLPQYPSGIFVTDSTIDGIERISAYQRIQGTSLVVYAGLSSTSVLSDWRHHTLSELLAATVLSLVICSVSYIAFIVLRRWQKENQYHRARMKTLSEGSAHLIQIKSIEAMLRAAAPIARQLTVSHQAAVSLTSDTTFQQDIAAVDLSEKYSAWRNYQAPTDGTGIYHLVCQSNNSIRMTQSELENHPAWKGFGAEKANHPPMRGWLAAPIVGEGGRNLGIIQVSDKIDGEFDSEDQALLIQLAQIVSSCIQNIRLLTAVDSTRQLAEKIAFEADQARAEIEALLRSMSDAYVIFDSKFNLVAANARAERIMESDLASMKGHHFLEIRPDVKDSLLWNEYQAAMRDRKPRDFTYHHKPTDRWIDIRVFPHKSGIAVYFRDITRRHLVEEQLQQAQKMDAIGQLTGGVAHDFNNLLTVILGNTDILAEQPDASPYARRLAELAREAAAKASELTNRLLAFSRRQQLAPEVIDVNRCILNATPLLERLLGERVKIRVTPHSDLWPALIDPSQLETAIMNLCVNSRDAMPSGGEITIRTWNHTVEETTKSKIPELTAGQYVCLSVADAGEGMTDETMAKAFEPFFTTKEVGKGTGLGLSMVYGFVKQSRGHVKIQSELGAGTTVQLYFPRYHKDEVDGHDSAEGSRPKPDRRILLVEDDELVRRHTRSMLEEIGYSVTDTEKADNALSLFREGEFDIIISDVILSGSTSGNDLLKTIKRLRPQQKILLVSGHGDNFLLNRGRDLDGVLFLQKPFRKSELIKILREMSGTN